MLEKKMREVKGLADNRALAGVLDKHLTNLGTVAAQMRKDRDIHGREDLDQIELERTALQREIKRLVPDWDLRHQGT